MKLDQPTRALVEWARKELAYAKDNEALWDATVRRERELHLEPAFALHQQQLYRAQADRLVKLLEPFSD